MKQLRTGPVLSWAFLQKPALYLLQRSGPDEEELEEWLPDEKLLYPEPPEPDMLLFQFLAPDHCLFCTSTTGAAATTRGVLPASLDPRQFRSAEEMLFDHPLPGIGVKNVVYNCSQLAGSLPVRPGAGPVLPVVKILH